MLISICGPQGSGKSTLLQGLKEESEFVDIKIVERKTSRSILEEWKISLQEVYQSNDLMMKFQDALLDRKYEDEKMLYDSPQMWFTERTFVDLLAYTVANLGRLNECSDWLDRYARKCFKYQSIYNRIIYLEGGLFPIVDDGVRPKNAMYGSMIDKFMVEHLTKSSSNVTIVRTSDLYDRIDAVKSAVIK